MADSISEPYFTLNRSLLNLLLLWPNDYRTKKNKLMFLFGITLALIICYVKEGMEFYYLLFSQAEDAQKKKTMAVLAFHTYCTIKHFHWIFQMPKLTQIILLLQRETIDIEKLYQETGKNGSNSWLKSEIKKRAQHEMDKARRTAKFLFYGYVTIMFFLLCTVYGVVLLAHTVFTETYLFGLGKTLPYETNHILDINDPTKFVFEVLISASFDLFLTLVVMGSDCCLMGILIFSTAQVKIIGIILEKNTCLSNMPVDVSYTQLRKCINEINNMDGIIKRLNTCSSNVILCQYLISIIFCIYVNILPNQNATMVFGIIMFLIIFSTQLLLIAWFCQTFTEEFSKLQYSVYNMNWVESEPKFRKMLVLTIARVQKPLSVTMGEFGPINLGVYIMVIKTAYSFYTLISKVSNK